MSRGDRFFCAFDGCVGWLKLLSNLALQPKKGAMHMAHLCVNVAI